MKLESNTPVDPGPRVSANQFAKYVFESPSGRLRILKEQKFGHEKRSYYGSALNGILKAFLPNTGTFETDILRKAEKHLRSTPYATKAKAVRLESNAEMLRRFSEICNKVRPPDGYHEVVRKNALVSMHGVRVSVRPEIITIRGNNRDLVLTKFRFSKDKVSADVSELVLQILLKFGSDILRDGQRLDLKQSCLVDCYSMDVFRGHTLPAIRERQLEQAAKEVGKLWPRVQATSKVDDLF